MLEDIINAIKSKNKQSIRSKKARMDFKERQSCRGTTR